MRNRHFAPVREQQEVNKVPGILADGCVACGVSGAGLVPCGPEADKQAGIRKNMHAVECMHIC